MLYTQSDEFEVTEENIMPIIKRIATSKEMKKNIKVVQRMTNGMKFDENMKNVNWQMVRKICDFGYTFMPK